ncbi:unnamed protein product [Pedinophyceae sp. YPF-701]|nr:unnamed protein product [Pedinophyceae sp. YPF-701]
MARPCRALEQIDYSFYLEMRNEDITEEALWLRLEPMLGYLPNRERALVRDALSLAYAAHDGQLRKSGEPYITHPVEVTRILAELRCGWECLAAGLLHDTVEDTDAVTFEGVEARYGAAVRTIVEGETKFSKIKMHADRSTTVKKDLKAVDLQQLFLAMTEEVRIIIVKLADRLHNMRTLGSMPPHKQYRIAEETLQVFAPLARLLGLYCVKEELEELSLRYLNPEHWEDLRRHLDHLAREQAGVVGECQAALEDLLARDQYLQDRVERVEVVFRQKGLYSLYSKLRAQSRGRKPMIHQVKDVAQLRVVIEPRAAGDEERRSATDTQLCYHVLGLVHARWAPIPGRMKDFIATSKPNGYRSLHTTVLPFPAAPATPGARNTTEVLPLEILIRTREMERLAEYGIAAEHWVPVGAGGLAGRLNGHTSAAQCDPAEAAVEAAEASLNGNGACAAEGSNGAGPGGPKPLIERVSKEALDRRINWLQSIREWQQEFVGSISAQEFVDTVTGDLFKQGVFVFTPAGQVMNLPKGSTVVDFAYHLHTGVGNTMVGAKVSGKMVPPETVLNNAEVVEVMTYSGPVTRNSVQRHRGWLGVVTTRSARLKLVRFLREHAWLLEGDDRVALEAALELEGMTPSMDGSSAEEEDELLARAEGMGAYWLAVDCNDRYGMLAEVSSMIASHGIMIKSHAGGAQDPVTGRASMKFELVGVASDINALCSAITAVQGVTSWSLGCPTETRAGPSSNGRVRKVVAEGAGGSTNGTGPAGTKRDESVQGVAEEGGAPEGPPAP